MSPRSAFSPIDEPSRSIASADGIESDLTNDDDPFGGVDSAPTVTTPLLVEAVLAEMSGRETMMSVYAWPMVELGPLRVKYKRLLRKVVLSGA